MSKKMIIIILTIIAVCSSALTSCNLGTDQGVVVDQNDNEPVCYYGCPNSKRVKKLNLKKTVKRLFN